MNKSVSDISKPQSLGGKGTNQKLDSSRQRSDFLVLAAHMTWQLALVVLIPVVGGVELDKVFDTAPVLLFVGLALAAAGSTAVMWQTMQTANKLPVPKLSEEQRKAIKKSYEEEDDD